MASPCMGERSWLSTPHLCRHWHEMVQSSGVPTARTELFWWKPEGGKSACPELAGVGGRAKLVVLAAEVGGRWSQESRQFLLSLASRQPLCTVSAPVQGESGLASPVELLVGVHRGQILRSVVAGWFGGWWFHSVCA